MIGTRVFQLSPDDLRTEGARRCVRPADAFNSPTHGSRREEEPEVRYVSSIPGST